MKKFSFLPICMLTLLMSTQTLAQNVGIGTTTPGNKLTVAGKANITDSLGLGIAVPQATLDVRGNTLLRGSNNNSFTSPLKAGVEFFVGRNSGGAINAGQNLPDMALNWGGAGGGFRHFIESRHDISPGVGNAIEFYLNTSGSATASTTPATGNSLEMAITGSGVGIGIDRPNPSAALEISSTNQGLLLPRVNDTSAVATPAEGLMIYNKATNTPSYFDGARWSSIQSSTATLNPQDSITYRITSPNGILLIAGTAYKAVSVEDFGQANISLSAGGISSSVPNMTIINFSKYFDINSIGFKRAIAAGTINNGTIEFSVFTLGAAAPYYSIKLTTWAVANFNTKSNIIDGKLLENYSLQSVSISFKNWASNLTFSYNASTNIISSTY